ncbi:MAG: hypothetical protein PSV35_02565, partial [bacterium]|nr:hypothetical protein [bacterium]
MAELYESPDLPPQLSTLIAGFNRLSDDAHIEKLFYLQKINFVMQQDPANPTFINWRNQLGESGLEAQLQRYSIHRDSPAQLHSIEFANAVTHFMPSKLSSPNVSFYTGMQSRDLLFVADTTPDSIKMYISINHEIMASYNQNVTLQEKMTRHQHFLALSYGKIDAIQGLVQQNFAEYQTKVLGSGEGNNKNFIFNIDGEDSKAIIRVESRNNLGREQILQTHEVSEYFSEDYVTLMVPFNDKGEIFYQPVVISELAKQGDLYSHAQSLAQGDPKHNLDRAQFLFKQFNDFSLKLMASGHYHPDIKLSNFLLDGDRLLVSDRKTFINNLIVKGNEILTSPAYATPEFKSGISFTTDENGVSHPKFNLSAYKTNLDMRASMSYQTGMALKEFMLASQVVPFNEDNQDDRNNKFSKWVPLTKFMSNPDNKAQNMSVLVQELTRLKPEDRLPIQHFQSLLDQAHLKPDKFMAKLEQLAPKEKLSNYSEMKLITEILTATQSTPELKGQMQQLATMEIPTGD